MADGANDRLHILRITLEALSPLSIGSGESRTEMRPEPDGTKTAIAIAGLQRDANGLPTIPGPGLQGALRRLAGEAYGDEFARELFGHEDEAHDAGRAGRVVWGWACAHDSAGAAVCGLRLEGLDTGNDGVLRLLAEPEPVWRDHVALSGRHSVDGRRKFARAAAPVGTRFSAELSGWGDDAFRENMFRLAALFRHPRLRVGGGSGRGYGRIELRAASYAEAPLGDANALRCLRGQPPSTPLKTDWLNRLEAPAPGSDTVLTLSLECEGPVRIGASGPHAESLTHRARAGRRVDDGKAVAGVIGAPADETNADGGNAILRLLREPYIVWGDDGRGRAVRIGKEVDPVAPEQLRFPVPGSAIRGPLAHRMLFHANGAAGRCIDADALDKEKRTDEAKRAAREESEKRDDALRGFFGAAKEAADKDRENGEGRAGRVLFDDAELRGASHVVGIDHVSIDRFTGGARELTGVLFREEVLLGGRIEARVVIRPPLSPASGGVGGWPRETAEAFMKAARDLCKGRIALGGRSHGTCRGKIRFAGKHAVAWREAARDAGAPLGEATE